MGHLKALTMIWQAPSDNRAPRQARSAVSIPAVLCRHCGGSRLKLSYRRYEKATAHDDGVDRTTFILRCADCEGFTTIEA